MNDAPDHPAAGDWTWPAALDAMQAAPAHHKLLFENEKIRVLESWAEPGEKIPVHTHRWPSAIYVLSWSDFVRRTPEGEVLLDSRRAGTAPSPGTVIWAEPLPPHCVEIVGNGRLGVIAFELKS